jgi:thiamine biosynthesis lipoprotein
VLFRSDPKVRIDCGGIAKGYIIDRAFDCLSEHGLGRCLINAGGDMRLGDPPPGRTGWRVEVAGLAVDQPGLRRLELSRCALATSGDLWQYQLIDGVRRSHIVDPRTGVGVPGPISVTVVAATAVEADAAATALTVMPPEAGFALVADRGGIEALWVRLLGTGEILWRATPGWAAWNVQP